MQEVKITKRVKMIIVAMVAMLVMLVSAIIVMKPMKAEAEASEAEFSIKVYSTWSGNGSSIDEAEQYGSSGSLYRCTVPYEAENIQVKVEGLSAGYSYKQQFAAQNSDTGVWGYTVDMYSSSPWKETITIVSDTDTEDKVVYNLEVWRGAQASASSVVGSKLNVEANTVSRAKRGDEIEVTFSMDTGSLISDGTACNFDMAIDKNVFEYVENSAELGSALLGSEENDLRATDEETLQIWLEGTAGLSGEVYLGKVKLRVKNTAPIGETAFAIGNETSFKLFAGRSNQIDMDADEGEEEFGYQLPTITIYAPSAVSEAASISTKVGSGEYAAVTFTGNAATLATVSGANNEINIRIVSPRIEPTINYEEQTVTIGGEEYNRTAPGTFEVAYPLNFNLTNNEIEIVVTAQDGEHSTTYTLTVPLGLGSADASLSLVELSKSGDERELTAVSGEYTASGILYANRAGWTLEAETGDANASIALIKGGETLASGTHSISEELELAAGTNNYTIKVTPQVGDAVDYALKVEVAISENSDVSGIVLTYETGHTGETISVSHVGTAYVSGEIAYADKDNVKLTVNAADALSTVKIDGEAANEKTLALELGDNDIEIEVLSESAAAGVNVSKKTVYTIKVTVVDDTDLSLAGNPAVYADGSATALNIEKKLVGNKEEYTVKYAEGTSKLKVNAIASDAVNAEVSIKEVTTTGDNEYAVGEEIEITQFTQELVVVVTAKESGKTAEYKINLKKEIAGATADVSIKGIAAKVDGATAEVEEIVNGKVYSVVVTDGKSVKVDVEPNKAGADVKINAINASGDVTNEYANGAVITVTSNIVTLNVIVSDVTESRAYAIHLVRESDISDVTLADGIGIEADGEEVEVAEIDGNAYVAVIKADVSEIEVSAVASDASNASVKVQAIKADGTQIGSDYTSIPATIEFSKEIAAIQVVVENGKKTATYTVSIKVKEADTGIGEIEIVGEAGSESTTPEIKAIDGSLYVMQRKVRGSETVKLSIPANSATAEVVIKTYAKDGTQIAEITAGGTAALGMAVYADSVEATEIEVEIDNEVAYIEVEVSDLGATSTYTILIEEAEIELGDVEITELKVKAGSKELKVIGSGNAYIAQLESGVSAIKVEAGVASGASVEYKTLSDAGEAAASAEITLSDAIKGIKITVTNGEGESANSASYIIALMPAEVEIPAEIELGIKTFKVNSGSKEVSIVAAGENTYILQLTKEMTGLTLSVEAKDSGASVAYKTVNGKGVTANASATVTLNENVSAIQAIVTNGGKSAVYTLALIPAESEKEEPAAPVKPAEVGLSSGITVTADGSNVTLTAISGNAYTLQLKDGMKAISVNAAAKDSGASIAYKTVKASGATSEATKDVTLTDGIVAVQVIVTNGEGESANSAVYTVALIPAEKVTEVEKSGGGNGGLIAVIVIFALLFVGATVLLVLELLGIFSLKALFGKKKATEGAAETDDTPKADNE